MATRSGESTTREARRRRIAERGADRLALITGRIQTLPTHLSSDTSSPESHLSEHSAPQPVSDLPLQSPPDNSILLQSAEASSFQSPQHVSAAKSDRIDTSDGDSGVELPQNDPSAISDKVSTNDVPQSLSSKLETSRRGISWVNRGNLFTPKQINSAITATENTRIYCSIAVAILVSLSYIGFPIPIIKSIVYYRPFYLVLITGISVVLKWLVFDGQGVQRQKREISGVPVMGGYGSVEQLGKILELGLCFKNISNAVFLDFSVYATVLVCALAFAQKLV